MNKDIMQWTQCCADLQMSIIGHHTGSGTVAFRQPKHHFGHLHANVVGPIPPSDGGQYFFTITECSIHWSDAIPMSNATARDCAETLLHG
ncbi:hypothetical protein Pcinc_000115 [Petrolisthes cinctipes]|uniref:Uncharacterized protein n=1 Tax=Petrolisthes cinctipes TaxID=88211 RepID=A0AAE1GSE9_PETCI|nr:hypothetical protein Pcinc_000115 [Petrolisthes cinctipes]